MVQFNLCLIKQSTATEINNFFEKIDVAPPTKQSFGIARRKLKIELFEDIFKKIAKKYYTLNNKANKPKYRIKAFDSTTVQVPDSVTNREIFGAYSNNTCTYASTKLCAYFDISQHLVSNLYLQNRTKSDINCAIEAVDDLESKDIGVYDRGFGGHTLMYLHSHKKKNYIIRQIADSSNTIANFVKSDENDIFITEHLNERAAKNLRESGYLVSKESDKVSSRLVKIILPTGEIEVLATNVLDLTVAELAAIYRLRWCIETYFSYVKNVFGLPIFSGYDQIAIEQDIWSLFTFYNLQSMFVNEANLTLEKTNQTKKRAYKINRAVGLNILKKDFQKLFIKGLENCNKACNKLINKLLRHTERVRTRLKLGAERNKKLPKHNRHSTERNYKHNFG